MGGGTGWPAVASGETGATVKCCFYRFLSACDDYSQFEWQEFPEFRKDIAPLSCAPLPPTCHTCVHMQAWVREEHSSLELTEQCDYNMIWDHIIKILITCSVPVYSSPIFPSFQIPANNSEPFPLHT